MKTQSTSILALCVLTLSACTTATQKHMRLADAQLKISEEKQRGNDWTGAGESLRQVRGSLQAGVAIIPVRKGASGDDVDLKPLLTALESGPVRQLESALKTKQPAQATAAYAQVRTQCTTCHAALGKPDIKITGW